MTNQEANVSPDEKLLSAGTAADSAGIQFLETISVVSGAVAIGAAVLTAWEIVALAALIAVVSTYLARRFRSELIEKNEIEVRHARYSFPADRQKTIELAGLPEDVRDATKELLVGSAELSRFRVAEKLSIRIGSTRANQYLPLVLQQGDRTLTTPSNGNGSAPPDGDGAQSGSPAGERQLNR